MYRTALNLRYWYGTCELENTNIDFCLIFWKGEKCLLRISISRLIKIYDFRFIKILILLMQRSLFNYILPYGMHCVKWAKCCGFKLHTGKHFVRFTIFFLNWSVLCVHLFLTKSDTKFITNAGVTFIFKDRVLFLRRPSLWLFIKVLLVCSITKQEMI